MTGKRNLTDGVHLKSKHWGGKGGGGVGVGGDRIAVSSSRLGNILRPSTKQIEKLEPTSLVSIQF